MSALLHSVSGTSSALSTVCSRGVLNRPYKSSPRSAFWGASPIQHCISVTSSPAALRHSAPLTSYGLFEAVGMKKPSWFPSFGASPTAALETSEGASIAQGPDSDTPGAGLQFATFGAGCFWGVELAYQRVPGVIKTEVGYTQGATHNPAYEAVCSGRTGHVEAVRVEYDPKVVAYEQLLDVLWSRHNPTTLNRQGGDVGTQYRSGIYFYSPEQEEAAKQSMDAEEKRIGRKIVTELLPAKKWYPAEKYHQQYLSKGGRFGTGQSAAKGCTDPIRCYG
eukprot:jgi/Mesen1/9955/ME000071S09359